MANSVHFIFWKLYVLSLCLDMFTLTTSQGFNLNAEHPIEFQPKFIT